MEIYTGILSGLILYSIIITTEFFKLKNQKKKLIKKIGQKEAELVRFTNYLEKIRGIDKNEENKK